MVLALNGMGVLIGPVCTSSSQSPPSAVLPVSLAEAAIFAPVKALSRWRNWLGFLGLTLVGLTPVPPGVKTPV